MLKCKKCNGQYRYIHGIFHCNSCGDFADTHEEVERFTLELYNCAFFSDINIEGKLSFLGGKKIEDNPYNGKNKDFNIIWEEGWKEGEEEHNKFMKIQELEEENRKLKEEILSQTQIILKEIKKKEILTEKFMILIKKINMALSPFCKKTFRFGQSFVVDTIVKDLNGLIDEVKKIQSER